MKKLFIILGSCFVLLLVIAGIGIGLLVKKGSDADTQSKAYADKAIVDITSTWDKQQFLDRSSPELKAVMTDPRQVDELFAVFQKLGHYQSHQISDKGGSKFVAIAGQGASVTATYTAEAHFENGPATINIDLIKHGDQWQILKFYIRSDLLTDAAAAKPAAPAAPE